MMSKKMKNSRLSDLFSVPVSVNSLELKGEKFEKIMKKIENIKKNTPSGKPDSWSSELYTTLNTLSNVHEMMEFEELCQNIMEKAKEYAGVFDFDIAKFPLRISSCWLNVYQRGQAQEIHVHPNNVISAIYYVQASEGAGNLFFHSPMSDLMYDPPKKTINQYNTKISGIAPVKGMLILFPSWLKHSVAPDKSIGRERISIAMNFMM